MNERPHATEHLAVNDPVSEKCLCACRLIVTGKPLPLLSKFRLSYYTLLNILRRLEGSGQSMEYVIARSFQQFQYEQSLPQVFLC